MVATAGSVLAEIQTIRRNRVEELIAVCIGNLKSSVICHPTWSVHNVREGIDGIEISMLTSVLASRGYVAITKHWITEDGSDVDSDEEDSDVNVVDNYAILVCLPHIADMNVGTHYSEETTKKISKIYDDQKEGKVYTPDLDDIWGVTVQSTALKPI